MHAPKAKFALVLILFSAFAANTFAQQATRHLIGTPRFTVIPRGNANAAMRTPAGMFLSGAAALFPAASLTTSPWLEPIQTPAT